MEDITKSQQNYLKAVYVLSQSGEGAQISDIAHMVGVRKSSASVAVKMLQRKRLVKRDLDRKVYVTPEGKRQAILVFDKYTIIRQFLTDVLHVDAKTADLDASAMEHLVSMEATCALCRYTNRAVGKCICSGGCRQPAGVGPVSRREEGQPSSL